MDLISFIKKRQWLRKPLLYIYLKNKVGKFVDFYWSSDLSFRCKFEGKNHIGKNSFFFGSLGYGTYIADNCLISAEIGRFCSIGSGFRYINATHPYKTPFVTTCPYFVSTNPNTYFGTHGFAKQQMMEEFLYFDKARELVNKIGNDVWIGLNVAIIGGVEIGDGAVVLTNATVTKNVPPYAIVGGVPAKIIGYRYDEETISMLLQTRWWEKDVKWLKEHWELMCDIEEFKKIVRNE